MVLIAIWANLFVSLVSVGFAVAAVFRPVLLSPSTGGSPGDRFFVFMYAARAIPFGILVCALPFYFRGVPTAFVLFAAAAIQAIDVAIAVSRKNGGMAAGASVAALVHFVCGVAML